MIDILEDNSRFRNYKKYFTAAGILIVTFAIPVTITQVFKTQVTSTFAQSNQPLLSTINNYINPQVIKGATSDFLYNVQTKDISYLFTTYWWVGVFILLIILLWVSMVIVLIKGRNS